MAEDSGLLCLLSTGFCEEGLSSGCASGLRDNTSSGPVLRAPCRLFWVGESFGARRSFAPWCEPTGRERGRGTARVLSVLDGGRGFLRADVSWVSHGGGGNGRPRPRASKQARCHSTRLAGVSCERWISGMGRFEGVCDDISAEATKICFTVQ